MLRQAPMLSATALALAAAAGCATTGSKMDSLPRAVSSFNELLRWGKIDGASSFLLPENQSAFLARYTAAEDDLHIESIEVRGVAYPPVENGSPLVAEVTVVAQAYLLPSTILAKTVIVQRWEHREGSWRLVAADRELAPALPEPDPPAAPPPAETPAESEPDAMGGLR